MAEIKDKIVTVESLSALHQYNKESLSTLRQYNKEVYETKERVDSVESSLSDRVDVIENRITPIEYGGTGSNDGSIGLQNLLASGAMVLSSEQYGDELPVAGTVGRIFFKRFTDV